MSVPERVMMLIPNGCEHSRISFLSEGPKAFLFPYEEVILSLSVWCCYFAFEAAPCIVTTRITSREYDLDDSISEVYLNFAWILRIGRSVHLKVYARNKMTVRRLIRRA